ncbi:hypothetical protein GJAV_G00273000 [Gymnothorax javanicus]|nr:hypothetical protein GJAV_G00273000 [Gymnothorax javanicus]
MKEGGEGEEQKSGKHRSFRATEFARYQNYLDSIVTMFGILSIYVIGTLLKQCCEGVYIRILTGWLLNHWGKVYVSRDRRTDMKMELRPLVMCFALCVVYATSKPTATEKKDRVHHEQLSDKVHDDTENFDYDHDAFLGQEDAKTFDQLTPEESKERLGMIVDKIDADKDGYVTEEELKAWIKKAQKKYIYDNVDRQWKDFDLNADGVIAWEEYKNVTYGTYLEDPDPDDGFNYKQMMSRDERRFRKADKDGNLIADKEEFTAFLHPEEYEYMKDIVVSETMEDIDKNGDGLIDLDEYIGDMYNHEGDAQEPEWVKTEREQFVEFRDKNRDGKMDKEETMDWILPSDYDHAEAEAKHLVYESDSDKDGRLTKEEIVNKYDLFVGSQATDFGEALVRHDEF